MKNFKLLSVLLLIISTTIYCSEQKKPAAAARQADPDIVSIDDPRVQAIMAEFPIKLPAASPEILGKLFKDDAEGERKWEEHVANFNACGESPSQYNEDQLIEVFSKLARGLIVTPGPRKLFYYMKSLAEQQKVMCKKTEDLIYPAIEKMLTLHPVGVKRDELTQNTFNYGIKIMHLKHKSSIIAQVFSKSAAVFLGERAE